MQALKRKIRSLQSDNMKKGSMTMDFLIFIAGLVILVLIASTAFGQGVMFNALSMFVTVHPQYLSEEVGTYMTAMSYIPADVIETALEVKADRLIEIECSDGCKVIVYSSLDDSSDSFETPFLSNGLSIRGKSIETSAGQFLMLIKDGNTLALDKTIGG